jgi:ferrous iron transport protein A
MRLADLKTGEPAKVIAVEGGHGIRQRLALRGISEGRTVTLLSGRYGPVVVDIGGSTVVIGRGMACRVLVEKAEP